MTNPSTPAPAAAPAAATGFDWTQLFTIIGTVAAAIAPGAVLGGFTIAQILSIAKGVYDGVPSIVAAYHDIENAVNGGAKPTPEQLLALKAAVDANDANIQAAIAEADAADLGKAAGKGA